MVVMLYVLIYIASILIYAASLWCAIKILDLKPNFKGALVIALITGTVSMVPKFGTILGLIALYILIVQYMYIDAFPDGFLMVAIAGVIRFVAVLGIIALITQSGILEGQNRGGDGFSRMISNARIFQITEMLENDYDAGYEYPRDQKEFSEIMKYKYDNGVTENDLSTDSNGDPVHYSRVPPNNDIPRVIRENMSVYIWENGPDGENDMGKDDDIAGWGNEFLETTVDDFK